MKSAKKRTTATVAFMIVLAIAILLFYYYWSNRTETLPSSGEKVSQEQALINKDLSLYYPETPREVVKMFAGIMKALYYHPSEDEIKPLALKVRELYDQELLNSNPEDTYLTNLYTDLSKWKKENRKITNFLLVNKDEEQQKEIDGVKYATVFVSYTIQENGKFAEVWKVILRQDAEKKWRILGWKLVPDNDSSISSSDDTADGDE